MDVIHGYATIYGAQHIWFKEDIIQAVYVIVLSINRDEYPALRINDAF